MLTRWEHRRASPGRLGKRRQGMRTHLARSSIDDAFPMHFLTSAVQPRLRGGHGQAWRNSRMQGSSCKLRNPETHFGNLNRSKRFCQEILPCRPDVLARTIVWALAELSPEFRPFARFRSLVAGRSELTITCLSSPPTPHPASVHRCRIPTSPYHIHGQRRSNEGHTFAVRYVAVPTR